ncbi:type II toxin-antitoxin system HicB family antitoxin [Citrobacter murliniae]
MSNMLKYKGYFGSVEFSLEDRVLHGKIQCVNDLVTYEAENLDGLQLAFEEAVDDYLDTCKALNKEPEKPMSGTFNVRIGSETP